MTFTALEVRKAIFAEATRAKAAGLPFPHERIDAIRRKFEPIATLATAPEVARQPESLDDATHAIFAAYLDALIRAKSATDPEEYEKAAREADRLWAMLKGEEEPQGATATLAGWVEYRGNRGGRGWHNPETGQIRYNSRDPNQDYSAQPKPKHPDAVYKDWMVPGETLTPELREEIDGHRAALGHIPPKSAKVEQYDPLKHGTGRQPQPAPQNPAPTAQGYRNVDGQIVAPQPVVPKPMPAPETDPFASYMPGQQNLKEHPATDKPQQPAAPQKPAAPPPGELRHNPDLDDAFGMEPARPMRPQPAAPPAPTPQAPAKPPTAKVSVPSGGGTPEPIQPKMPPSVVPPPLSARAAPQAPSPVQGRTPARIHQDAPQPAAKPQPSITPEQYNAAAREGYYARRQAEDRDRLEWVRANRPDLLPKLAQAGVAGADVPMPAWRSPTPAKIHHDPEPPQLEPTDEPLTQRPVQVSRTPAKIHYDTPAAPARQATLPVPVQRPAPAPPSQPTQPANALTRQRSFMWAGKDKNGKPMRGRLTAANGDEALAQLAGMGHMPHEVYESGVANPPNLAEKEEANPAAPQSKFDELAALGGRFKDYEAGKITPGLTDLIGRLAVKHNLSERDLIRKAIAAHTNASGLDIMSAKPGDDEGTMAASKGKPRPNVDPNRAYGHEHRILRQKAQAAGFDPNEVQQIADHIQKEASVYAEQRNEMLRDARRRGIDVTRRGKDKQVGGKEDEQKGFDDVASQMASEYPHLFREHTAANGGSHEDQLRSMLLEGNLPVMTPAQAYAKAIEKAEEERYHKRMKAEVEDDTDEDEETRRKREDYIPFSTDAELFAVLSSLPASVSAFDFRGERWERLSGVEWTAFLNNDGWEPYHGPRGGVGWQNVKTRRIVYTSSPTAPGYARRQVEASTQRAMELGGQHAGHLRGAGQKALTPQELNELADHVNALPVAALRSLRQHIMATWGGAKRRQQMVEALTSHVRGLVDEHRQREAMVNAGAEEPLRHVWQEELAKHKQGELFGEPEAWTQEEKDADLEAVMRDRDLASAHADRKLIDHPTDGMTPAQKKEFYNGEFGDVSESFRKDAINAWGAEQQSGSGQGGAVRMPTAKPTDPQQTPTGITPNLWQQPGDGSPDWRKAIMKAYDADEFDRFAPDTHPNVKAAVAEEGQRFRKELEESWDKEDAEANERQATDRESERSSGTMIGKGSEPSHPMPFPVKDSPPFEKKSTVEQTGPVADVPTKSLVATQPTLDQKYMEELKGGAEPRTKGHPKVVKIGDEHHIDDGHHRAAHEASNGAETIKAEVFEHDPATKKVTPAKSNYTPVAEDVSDEEYDRQYEEARAKMQAGLKKMEERHEERKAKKAAQKEPSKVTVADLVKPPPDAEITPTAENPKSSHLDLAKEYAHGGVIHESEATELRDTYAALPDTDRTRFAESFGIENAARSLPETRDDLVERKIKEMAHRGKEGPEVKRNTGNPLFGERGVGESKGLFDGEPEKPEAETPVAPPADAKPAGKDAEGREQMVGKNGAVYVRAKAGGQVSPVNGQHYEGGWWMPIHGKSPPSKGGKGDGTGDGGPAGDGEGGRPRQSGEKKKGPRQNKTRDRMGDLVNVPEGHRAIESLLAGSPTKVGMLNDTALDYLGLTRKQAKDLADIWERDGGSPYVPNEILPPSLSTKGHSPSDDWNIDKKYREWEAEKTAKARAKDADLSRLDPSVRPQEPAHANATQAPPTEAERPEAPASETHTPTEEPKKEEGKPEVDSAPPPVDPAALGRRLAAHNASAMSDQYATAMKAEDDIKATKKEIDALPEQDRKTAMDAFQAAWNPPTPLAVSRTQHMTNGSGTKVHYLNDDKHSITETPTESHLHVKEGGSLKHKGAFKSVEEAIAAAGGKGPVAKPAEVKAEPKPETKPGAKAEPVKFKNPHLIPSPAKKLAKGEDPKKVVFARDDDEDINVFLETNGVNDVLSIPMDDRRKMAADAANGKPLVRPSPSSTAQTATPAPAVHRVGDHIITEANGKATVHHNDGGTLKHTGEFGSVAEAKEAIAPTPESGEEGKPQIQAHEIGPDPVGAQADVLSKHRIEDFGEKIGGARKDMARPTGPRAKTAMEKPVDERPGWARRYHVGQDAKTGRWFVADTAKKSRYGPSLIRGADSFATKEDADAAVPLLEVARNHRVRAERMSPEATRAYNEASRKNADDWLQGVTKRVGELKDRHAKLLFGVEMTDRFNKALAEGRMTQEQYEKQKKDGAILSPEDYQKGKDIQSQIEAIKEEEPEDVKPPEARTYAIHRVITDRKMPVVKGGFASEADAMKYMATHPEEIINHEFPFPSEVPHLEHVERTGEAKRKSHVSPKDFQSAFGFRGGEFGNWNQGEHGQAVLNHAFDGLHDLADTLGLPPKAISLDGKLAVGFGSRGHGGKDAARAHYERDKTVINLTKMKGAGTFAHEWFHALDHHIGQMAGKNGSDREGSYASHGFPYKHTADAELASAFKNVIDTMTAKTTDQPITADFETKRHGHAAKHLNEVMADIDRGLEGSSYRPAKPLSAEDKARWSELKSKVLAGELGEQVIVPGQSRFGGRYSNANIEEMNKIYKKATGRSFITSELSSRGHQLIGAVKHLNDTKSRVAKAIEGATESKKIPTDYFDQARQIDNYRASDYWATPHELAARAFESYVKDKIEGRGNRSDYLVYGTKNTPLNSMLGKPYPEGEERTKINAAFDRLLEAVRKTAVKPQANLSTDIDHEIARQHADVETMIAMLSTDVSEEPRDNIGRWTADPAMTARLHSIMSDPSGIDSLSHEDRKGLIQHLKGLHAVLSQSMKQPKAEVAVSPADPQLVRWASDLVKRSANPDALSMPDVQQAVLRLGKMPAPAIHALLAASGVEGTKPTDSRVNLLRRFQNRLTAAARARARAEV